MYHYLASPYSHISPDTMEKRFQAAELATATFLLSDVAVYSPIVHGHQLGKMHNLPTDFKFWMRYNYRMLSPALSLIVLKITGWEESIGVQAEIEYAVTHGKPVRYADPGRLLMCLDDAYAA